MKMEKKKFSKENLIGIARNVGNVTKHTATSIGTATKNAAVSVGSATKTTAVSVAGNMKESKEKLEERMEQRKYDNDKKRLCPVYEEDLLSEDFTLPFLIHIVAYDKRMKNKACEGAIGFLTGKDVKMLNVYREFTNLLGVTFYPILEETVYYVDPCHRNLYVRLDQYFAYLKKVRVDELTMVAQNLGAKHVEIILKSNQKSLQSKGGSGGFSIMQKAGEGEASFSKTKTEQINIEVAAKVDFGGNERPSKPELVYFKNESDINALIQMRLNPANENKILSKTYSLQYGDSTGIKINEAQKIDVTIKSANCGLGRSFTKEVLSENNTTLEYQIVF